MCTSWGEDGAKQLWWSEEVAMGVAVCPGMEVGPFILTG